MMLSSRRAPSSICVKSSSSETPFFAPRASCSARTRWPRSCARWRAWRSFSTTRACSPAAGGLSKPRISTGVPGVASFTFSPRKSSSARTLPQASPATMPSPTRSVPRRDEHRGDRAAADVQTAFDDRPGGLRLCVGVELELGVRDEQDLLEEIVDPLAGLGGDVGELRRPAPLLRLEARAPTSSWRTFCEFASGLSILLTATSTGTSAALAWLIDSMVCGMTPSSAATTSTAMSVTFAPRARRAVNASWPGVSRKVMRRPSWSIWYAPMCCVIPPASVSTTALSRIASRSVVFPWSTWPMIVTTGGRAVRSAGSSS